MFRVLLLIDGGLGALVLLVSNVLNAAARVLGQGWRGCVRTIGDGGEVLNYDGVVFDDTLYLVGGFEVKHFLRIQKI
jgi:hypothetical protein